MVCCCCLPGELVAISQPRGLLERCKYGTGAGPAFRLTKTAAAFYISVAGVPLAESRQVVTYAYECFGVALDRSVDCQSGGQSKDEHTPSLVATLFVLV